MCFIRLSNEWPTCLMLLLSWKKQYFIVKTHSGMRPHDWDHFINVLQRKDHCILILGSSGHYIAEPLKTYIIHVHWGNASSFYLIMVWKFSNINFFQVLEFIHFWYNCNTWKSLFWEIWVCNDHVGTFTPWNFFGGAEITSQIIW